MSVLDASPGLAIAACRMRSRTLPVSTEGPGGPSGIRTSDEGQAICADVPAPTTWGREPQAHTTAAVSCASRRARTRCPWLAGGR